MKKRWDGKTKAVTFSYDDGVESDRKLVAILNAYGLKGTFNLNSALLGDGQGWDNRGFLVKRLAPEGLRTLYAGHEIAVHGSRHLTPTGLNEEAFAEEFVQDRERLEKLIGTKPVGMAYAFGAYDEELIKRLRGIGFLYGRTVWDSMGFDLQKNLLAFRPTCHHNNERLFDLLEQFLSSPCDASNPQLFYLWGHSYEFDTDKNWDRIERFCREISGRQELYFGTNREVLLG